MLFDSQSVMGLSHREVIELILGGGTKVKLSATELAKTSIKRGGRKRVLSASKQVRKKLPFRRGRKGVTSPNLPSPGPEAVDKQPKQKPFWKRFGRRASQSISPANSLRRTSSLKRVMSSPDSPRAASPKLGSHSFDFRALSDQSSSSVGSSPASSPSSPSAHGLGRPGGWESFIFFCFVLFFFMFVVFCLGAGPMFKLYLLLTGNIYSWSCLRLGNVTTIFDKNLWDT